MKFSNFERNYRLCKNVLIDGRLVWLEMTYTVKGVMETYETEHCMAPEYDSPDCEEGEVTDIRLICAVDEETNEDVNIEDDRLFDIATNDFNYTNKAVEMSA